MKYNTFRKLGIGIKEEGMIVPRIVAVFALALILRSNAASEEDRARYTDYFEKAAAEFNVPVDVLKGISFAETRWSHLTWAVGDTASACNGMPRPYGIMSLWDNNHFGHSLRQAAELLGKSPDELKNDPFENIRGAAALLRKFYNELPKPGGIDLSDIASWRNAIAAFSGLPQIELSQQHALDIYTQMTRGYHQFGIEWEARQVNLAPMRAAVAKIQEEAKAKTPAPLRKTANQPDYPLAKWAQAADGHWYTSGFGDYFVVIHDMEGYYLSVISYFQDPATQASAHFCINSLQNGPGENRPGDAPAGEITQMVELKYWAWHVVCWNRYMVGIEHEGFVNTAAWYSNEMYNASGKLTAWLCNRFNIPKDRNHIIAHGEWQNATWKSWMATNFPAIDVTCNNHTDPGPFWNWDYYMSIVKSDTATPIVSSAYPAGNANNIPAYKDVQLTFSSYMDSASTNKAFSISPNVAGTKSWTAGFTTLKFHPANILAFSTTYTVKIDSSAKSASSGKSIGTTYQFTFTTEKPDTTPPAVVKTYPKTNGQNTPLLPDIYVTLNKPLQYSSLVGRVALVDTTGLNVPYANAKLDSLNGEGIISFTSSQLKPNNVYQVKLLAGLIDVYGNPSKADYVWSFSTTRETVNPGLLFDGFETNTRGWLQPLTSAGTVFADSSLTAFMFSAEKKMDGSLAGKLTYGFTKSSGGKVFLEASGRPTLDSYSNLGVWIAGDESGTQLDAMFQPSNQGIPLAVVDWRGWKFVSVPLSSITGPTKQFSAIIVKQTDSSSMSGTLYFDDMQLNATTSDVRRSLTPLPVEYSLEQNYPNPFNPTTNVRFTIPELRFVTLKIYDMLGREVSTLVHQTLHPGVYSIEWNALMVSSGVYYYILTAGEFSSVKKMVLLK